MPQTSRATAEHSSPANVELLAIEDQRCTISASSRVKFAEDHAARRALFEKNRDIPGSFVLETRRNRAPAAALGAKADDLGGDPFPIPTVDHRPASSQLEFDQLAQAKSIAGEAQNGPISGAILVDPHPSQSLLEAGISDGRHFCCSASTPGWAFLRDNQDQLLGRLDPGIVPAQTQSSTPAAGRGQGAEKTPLDEEFAAIDALIARTSRRLVRGSSPAADARATSTQETPDRLTEWRTRLSEVGSLSPVAAAAAAGHAWDELSPIENTAWLGRLLAAEVLRVRGKTRVHLCTLNIGLKSVARADRQSRDPEIRHRAWVQGFALAAEAGLRDHDRWLAAKIALRHKIKGRRVNSKLPALVDLVLRQPLVTSTMIAQELKISARAAQDLAGELGLREMTGRARYRAWGIL